MKGMLENIWNWYLEEHAAEQSEEEKRLMLALDESEKALRELLDESQRDALQKYENLRNKMDRFLETKAFSKGVRFATAYMADAMDHK